MARLEKKTESAAPQKKLPLRKRVVREITAWGWVLLAFLLIHGTLVHGRVIPSPSMEGTLLVGDHLLVSRFGYDAEIPFTGLHLSLWREPRRQQVIIFRPPVLGASDYVKRIIGVPGDRLEIRTGAVWINGRPLDEPYLSETPDPVENRAPVLVPPGHYFMMGDNRRNSYDSRYWGFVPRSAIVGTPLFIYMSVDAPGDVWEPGHLRERFATYASAAWSPSIIRWRRLFVPF